MTPRRALAIVIVLATLVRLGWAAGLGVGNDEAYYYLFTLHPDWSYYDHPPMLALVEGFGLSLAGGGVSPLALRLGFLGLFVGSSLLMARLARRVYDERAAVFAAFALNASGFYGIAAGVFALPDGPLLFFWLLTLDRLIGAFERPEAVGRWVVLGLAWGGAMLSKYHAVFLPAGAAFYLVVEPGARAVLRRPGPYVALATGLLLFSPVLGWNASHGWASFAFQAGRAVGDFRFRPDLLLGFVAGHALYLFPWIWVPLVGVLGRSIGELWGFEIRRADRVTAREPAEQGARPPEVSEPTGSARRMAMKRLLLVEAVLPLGGFLTVACFRQVLPHWALVGYLPLMPILGHVWAQRWLASPKRLMRRFAVMACVPVFLGVFAVLQTQAGLIQQGAPGRLGILPALQDPSVDLYGWENVAKELRARGLVNRPGTFLFTSKWYYSGQLAFALRGEGPVACYSPSDPHGFAQWSRAEDWVGQDGILVVINDSSTEPAAFDRWFQSIEPLGEFDVKRAGGRVRTVHLYRCVRQTKPFPLDGSRAGTARARVASYRAIGDNHGRR